MRLAFISEIVTFWGFYAAFLHERSEIGLNTCSYKSIDIHIYTHVSFDFIYANGFHFLLISYLVLKQFVEMWIALSITCTLVLVCFMKLLAQSLYTPILTYNVHVQVHRKSYNILQIYLFYIDDGFLSPHTDTVSISLHVAEYQASLVSYKQP